MNRQWKGIVFMDFRDESAPHFILNLIEELQREKIVESIAPCQTFAKSFMMFSPATGRKDLVLLLRSLSEESMERLETWRNNQGEQTVMILSDYVKQYSPEFTGIGQQVEVVESNGFDKKIGEKDNNPPQKSRRSRRQRDRSPKQVGSNVENESAVEISTNDDVAEVSEDTTEREVKEDSDEAEIEGA
jgi:hypothetical protein